MAVHMPSSLSFSFDLQSHRVVTTIYNIRNLDKETWIFPILTTDIVVPKEVLELDEEKLNFDAIQQIPPPYR